MPKANICLTATHIKKISFFFKSISRKFYQVDKHGYEISTINGIKENNSSLTQGQVLKIIRDGVYQADNSNNIKSDSVN